MVLGCAKGSLDKYVINMEVVRCALTIQITIRGIFLWFIGPEWSITALFYRRSNIKLKWEDKKTVGSDPSLERPSLQYRIPVHLTVL